MHFGAAVALVTGAAAYQLVAVPNHGARGLRLSAPPQARPLFLCATGAAGSSDAPAGSSDAHAYSSSEAPAGSSDAYAGEADCEGGGHGMGRSAGHQAMSESTALLDALDHWLRRQTISSMLPKSQAKQLFSDLRTDQRFWAQQRRQFARAWVLVEAGLRAETRPMRTLLGNETAAKILSATEAMETDPALVNALVRSEIVEAMLGYVLYNGIGQFMLEADLVGAALNNLPVLGPIRAQLLQLARANLDSLVGPQVCV